MPLAPFALVRTAALAAGLMAGLTAAGAQDGTGEADLTAHRAVYDLTLARTEPSVNMLSGQGRLVFEIEGAACEGYTVNSRFVTRTVDREGETQTSDLRSATFETLEPAEFNFNNETLVEDSVASVLDGTAVGRASGTQVEITTPKERMVELPRAVFPTRHTLLILDSAREGERVLEAPVFDGGGNADEVYSTTSVIGPPATGLPGASERERKVILDALPEAAQMTVYKLVISYFTQGAEGESVPDYVISFQMLDNGMSYDATFDYGGFVLTGRLAELQLGPETVCPSGGAAGTGAAPVRP